MKPTISLCMITKDEENLLVDSLNQIKDIVDEIIIVDTGSKDKTKEIAKKFTTNVYDFKWNDDFSKARNFSISKATKDWILVLDPDEKIEKKDLIKLKRTIHQQQSVVVGGGGGIKFAKQIYGVQKVGPIGILGYRLIQKTYYKNKVTSIRGICRLFKNTKKSAKQISGVPEIQRISKHNKNIRFTYPIHETVRESIKNLKASIGKTGITIKHYPKISKEKQEYYLRLLKTKKEKFPNSNVDKEIENEYALKDKCFS